jgi:hypothetical protein
LESQRPGFGAVNFAASKGVVRGAPRIPDGANSHTVLTELAGRELDCGYNSGKINNRKIIDFLKEMKFTFEALMGLPVLVL